MTVSKLATETWPLGKTSTGHNRFYRRPSDPQGFIVHHAAMLVDSSLKYQYVSPSRELSSNYAMRQNGDIVAILHEEYRPFTSSSARADNWGITIEIANELGAPSWKISDRAFDQLARLIADCATRWKFPINRTHVIGHREVLPKFGQGIATACPGPWLYSRMDELCALAKKYQAAALKPSTPAAKPEAATTTQGGDDMIVIENTDTGHVYAAAKQFLRHETHRPAGERTARLLTSAGEIVGLNSNDFREVLNALGIPLSAERGVLEGKLWSPHAGIIDARTLDV